MTRGSGGADILWEGKFYIKKKGGRDMKQLAVYLVTILFLAVTSVTVYGGEEGGNVKALFEKKCSLCHSIDRPKSKKKSGDGWKSTVTRMKNVNGAPVTDEEAKMIIQHLTDNYGT
jgi:hypothetical protein